MRIKTILAIIIVSIGAYLFYFFYALGEFLNACKALIAALLLALLIWQQFSMVASFKKRMCEGKRYDAILTYCKEVGYRHPHLDLRVTFQINEELVTLPVEGRYMDAPCKVGEALIIIYEDGGYSALLVENNMLLNYLQPVIAMDVVLLIVITIAFAII